MTDMQLNLSHRIRNRKNNDEELKMKSDLQRRSGPDNIACR